MPRARTDAELAAVFGQDPRAAVFVSRAAFWSGAPILRVFHDSEGDWQFISSPPEADEMPALVALEEIVHLDRSVAEVGDLPEGWAAERAWVGGPWTRFESGD